jgi:putative DNA primase/helicase
MPLPPDDPFLASPPLTHEQLRNVVTARRVALLKLGYEPIPILSGRKRPPMNGWSEIRITIPPDEDVIMPWADTYPGALSTGIRTRYTPGFDIDIKDEIVADQVEQALLHIIPSGTILKRIGQPPKRLIPFRCTTPFKKLVATFKAPDDTVHKVEVLADGQQFVAEGIHETTQQPYRWVDDVGLINVAHERLPLVDKELARRFVAEAGAIMERAGWVRIGNDKTATRAANKVNGKAPDSPPSGKVGSSIYGRTALKDECAKLAAMPKDSGRNDALNTASFNLFQLIAGGELDEEKDQVRERLFAAAEACGLIADDGEISVCKTIESGAKAGRAQARQAPTEATGAEDGNANDASLLIVRANELEMRGIEWLWPGRFALGKISLLAGLPDYGKGQIAAFIAATVTAAIELPCEEGAAPRGNVVWFNAEDDARDTVLPRLVAAGADTGRVRFVNGTREEDGSRGTFSLITDLPLLRNAIKRIGSVVLIIIDPVSAYLGVGRVDSRSQSDVRGVLTPLKELAEEAGAAIIGICHFNKKSDVTSALLRVSDSIAFTAAARSVYVVLDDPEDSTSKLFLKAKNNLAPDKKALRYGFSIKTVGHDTRLKKDIDAPYVVWHPQHIELSANEVMQAAASGSGYAKKEAREFLLDRLEAGPVNAEDVTAEAEQNGITKRTLFRAKKDLGVKSRKERGKMGGGWTWELPPQKVSRHAKVS